MATRRPRVKPTAILKSRRPQSAQQSETTPATSLKAELCDEIGDAIAAPQPDPISDEIAPNETIDTKTVLQSVNKTDEANGNDIEAKPDVGGDVKDHAPANVSGAKPFRRLITPSVNMVNRRKFPTENRPFNLASPVQGARSPGHMRSPAHMKSPAYSYMYENAAAASPRKIDEKPISSPKIGATNEDEVFSPAPENDECFKSPPFMSPSIYSRRPDMSPYTDAFSGEDNKSHGTALVNGSNKIRQRIRPTPCFNRRNSIQGVSESDDETGRRQRHYSTSSTYSSNYNPGSTPQQTQRNYFGLNKTYSRIRTESMCSNVSEAASMRDINSRPKRMHRSEEFQRVANAKREFNQRLNGKVPDKSRLTMYDMIYYNPVTNPMTRPAVKSEMKDRNDNSSVSSIRTIESRHSVKSEPKVKAENTDSNQDAMPVPQLKLGPNGEIILDEKSLVIETTGKKEAREMLANSDIVYDDEFSGTSGFYKRHKRTKDWPAEETIKFYRSLQAVGTDFSVMLQLFPNRSRRDLKLKFKKEERHNMALINKALLHPKEFNVEELMLQFEKEDRDKETKKAEWADLAQKMSRERKEQINVIKKRAAKRIVSPSARCLTDGDKLYENEFVAVPKRRKMNRATWNDGAENEARTVENSPIPASPFAQPSIPSTPIRSPTYATHKLPSFNEMISSHKSSSYNATTNINNNHLIESVNKDDHRIDSVAGPTEITQTTNLIVIPNDDGLPVPATSAPIVSIATASDSSSITITDGTVTQSSIFSGTIVQPYTIEKDSNLTYKSSADDIMSMDIIFDNVPIEEDPTIGSNVTIMHETATSAIAPDTIHYEIVDFDGTVRTDSVVQHQLSNANYSQVDDSSNDGILVIDESVQTPIEYNEIVLDARDLVIVSSPPPPPMLSKLDVAAGVPSEQSDTDGIAWLESTTSNGTEEIETKQILVSQPEAANSRSESAVKHEKPLKKSSECNESVTGSGALLKRKRKPLPTLIGRNKKSKTEVPPAVIQSNAEVNSKTIVPNEYESVAENKCETSKPEDLPVLIEHSGDIKNETTVVIKRQSVAENECEISKTEYPPAPIESKIEIDNEMTVPNEYENAADPFAAEVSTSTQLYEEETDSTPVDDGIDSDRPLGNQDGTDNSVVKNESNESEASNFMDSLVVVESQDPNDASKTIHEVYMICPETKQMSEQPLDLPDEVIQRIRLSMTPGAE